MSALTLLHTLEGLGVHASVTPSGKLRLEPASLVPTELMDDVKALKSALIESLNTDQSAAQAVTPQAPVAQGVTQSDTLPPLTRLPDAFTLMVQAAAGNQLNRPALLPSGLVMSLGDYVLASAALYAAGIEPGRQLQALWAARGAWAA